MARPRSFTEDELIALINEYYLEYPNRMIKTSDLERYAKTHGRPNFKAYSIRRCPKAKQYIDQINASNQVTLETTIVTWRQLDVDAFLNLNSSRSDLKNALIQRDNYYGEVCRSAGEFLNDKNRLEAKITRMQSEINDLKNQIAELEQMNTKRINRYSQVMLSKMKKVLDTYVYPDIANEILKKEGLGSLFGLYVNPESVESEMITPDSVLEITSHQNISDEDDTVDSIQNLMGGFDDE
ncbi:hypothetical protein [Holdemanella biformis]|uniref:hypothetical protein n=1 Tax=Holdemanella biformis TaxID=1735 RepID=UPI0022E5A786|nr:hypothetical protein [Holdemanella biformis]